MGVEYYNQQHGTDVEVFGWNPVFRICFFTGNFENGEDGRRMGEQILNLGADVILPVAGIQGFGTAGVILEYGGVYIIGVDFDWALAAPEYAEIILTLILQHFIVSIFQTIQKVVEGNFTGGTYTGSLERGDLGLAPFHYLDRMVF